MLSVLLCSRAALRPLAWCCAVVSLGALSEVRAASDPAALPEGFFDRLELRHIGPLGNRVTAVAGVAGDPDVYYAGAASGGIFETTDGGGHWRPIFDEQPAASIGSLAVARSDPNVVWAGTGETFLRSNVSIGNGVYRSTDAGRSWRHVGLEKSGRIGRIVIHPRDPDTVYAAALGHCYGPQEERGLYRTRDGGTTWERVLFVDTETGAIDLAMDPNNPRILFAATWQIEMSTWGRQSGGPGSGIFASRDGGTSWQRLEGNGLPDPPWGKIGLAMSAADSDRIYALIETSSNPAFASVPEDPGVLWRSDDGGASWTLRSRDNTLIQRPLYYTRAVATPDDADEITFLAVQQSLSLDGGATFEENNSGWDHHDMWIDPLDGDRQIVGHDGGASISRNRGKSWSRPQLPIAQMYHVATDDEIPYRVYGNRQDGPALRGPSRALDGDDIPLGAWHSVGGCEVGFAVPVPRRDERRSDLVWTGCYDGILELYDGATGHARDTSVWPLAVESWPAEELRYRFQWSFPIAISPHDPDRVYVGSQFVHRTDNGGRSWETISPDLTTDDPELQRRSGGLTLDDAGPTIAPVVFALAESHLEPGLIWAGTNDGQVQASRDGGATWTNRTANLPSLPPLGTVSNVEPSRHAAATAYLTVDRHQLGDSEPYVFRTRDYGRSFERIDAGLPRSVFGYAHCVREDPVRAGLLYLGTENGLWVSFDDGGAWHSLQSNLPHAPVSWLTVQEHFGDLVIATYGRGFWILDDLSAVRAVTAELLAVDAALVPPRPVYRLRRREPAMRHPQDPAAGTNPDEGAFLHYYLREETAEEVTLTVYDAAGRLVRKLDELSQEAGLHRVVWDLRWQATEEVRLRNRPRDHPQFDIPESGWWPLPDGGRFSLLAPPDRYSVELAVGEHTWREELVVRKDPGSAGSMEDIGEQMELLFQLRDAVNRAAALLNGAEWLRRQLDDLEALPGGIEDDELRRLLDAARKEVEDLESAFFDLRLTPASQDTLRWKRLLYARLVHLARRIGKTDDAPTEQHREVTALLTEELAAQEARWNGLREERVPELDAALRDAGRAGIVVLRD